VTDPVATGRRRRFEQCVKADGDIGEDDGIGFKGL